MITSQQSSRYWMATCPSHDGYLFSFSYSEVAGDGSTYSEKIDVYCFDNGHNKQEFCLRFGDEGHEYYSPGGLENIISARDLGRYNATLIILKEYGTFQFVPRNGIVQDDKSRSTNNTGADNV